MGAFLSVLESEGELHRVTVPVSPILEISEIADRQCKLPAPSTSEFAPQFDPGHHELGGKALLFENVEGSDFPLVINAYGSYMRTEMAFGKPFPQIAARIASLTKPEPPRSFGEAWGKLKEFLPLLRVPPKRVKKGACQEVVDTDFDLTRLPILKCWPLDGDPEAVGYPVPAHSEGRYITLAGIHTIHHRDKGVAKPPSHNIGMYRVQLLGPKKLAMHWHMHHDGASHWRSWKRAGEPMPVAIVLGGESVLPYAATAPLPPGISELLMAGFLHGRGIPMVPAKTVPLRVPANAEIVIEGFVRTDAGFPGYDPRTGEEIGPGAVFEGPFGDHTGFYSLPDRYPIVEVTAVTHRRDAVYPTTIVGLPPQEDYYLGKATERIFMPLLKTILHDLDDYHLPMFGCFHNCAFVRIHKEYPLQARRVMHAIWGAGQMAWTKVIVVVDQDVNVHDEAAVWQAIMENCHFGRDLEIVNGPLDILDHAAPRLGAGGKLGIDATRKIPGEEVNGVPHDKKGGGKRAIVVVDKQERGDGVRALEKSDADLTIAVDVECDEQEAFFRWCANWDPIRDTVQQDGRVGFDATTKLECESRLGQPSRDYPPILEMDQATRDKVTRRWAEYGFQ
ncbi:MAG: menaquinone biosynthesis decarboxylase [Planctomycetota bacterium]